MKTVRRRDVVLCVYNVCVSMCVGADTLKDSDGRRLLPTLNEQQSRRAKLDEINKTVEISARNVRG